MCIYIYIYVYIYIYIYTHTYIHTYIPKRSPRPKVRRPSVVRHQVGELAWDDRPPGCHIL